MGRFNSALTRVQPIFDALRQQDPGGAWLMELWRMARTNREGDTVQPPPTSGSLLPGKGYERVVPPSTAFLRWAVEHPDRLTQLPAPDYGASGDVAKSKRAALFGDDEPLRDAVIAEALNAIGSAGGKGSAQQWWAFEGFTHVDACMETGECLLLIEGRRTETVVPSTRWFGQRNQLWRNVEVAEDLAGGRHFGVILGVESSESGLIALRDADATRDNSYPHLSDAHRTDLDRHLIGFVVWPEVVTAFGLPPSVMLDSYEPESHGHC